MYIVWSARLNMWGMRSSRLQSSGTWCCVVWLIGTNSLEEPFVTIFKVEGLVPVYQTRWCCIPENPNLESNAVPEVLLSKLVQAALLLTYLSIRKVSDSSLAQDTKVYHGFHQSLQANARIVPQIRPWSYSFIFFPVHNTLIPSFSAVLLKLLA